MTIEGFQDATGNVAGKTIPTESRIEGTLEALSTVIADGKRQIESETGDKVIAPFTLIVPMYNEQDAVDKTLEQLTECLDQFGVEYELIAVNDGSTDQTPERLARWTDRVNVIHHPRNKGYGASLKTALMRAKHDWIVITDADGSYPNERIPELLEKAQDFDMVVGARTGANVQYPFMRKVAKAFLVRFAEWLSGNTIPDMNSGLRVFRKKIAKKFIKLYPNGFSFTTTITLAMLTNGYRVLYEPIDYHARIGKSKIQPIRDTLRFTQLILRTSMYFAPLRVFLPVSMIFSLGFLVSLSNDLFILSDLTESTLIMMVASMQFLMFALLADLIAKRSGT